jgi:hypothetical protein
MISSFLYVAGSGFLLIATAEWLTAWFQPTRQETETVNVAAAASSVIALVFFLLALLRKFGV